ncbi:MAG: NAD(+) synthase, partial [Paludibacteraceae bacterium]|nr:NAD(+) synthase [Paludibacteraceae bacterium]
MKHGFIKAATITPELKVADVDFNCEKVLTYMDDAAKQDCKVVIFPDLCIKGYRCHDLFLQDELVEKAKEALFRIAEHSKT